MSQDQLQEFSAFFLAETSVLDLELPDGEPMLFGDQQVKVHLFGPSTAKYAKAKAALDKEAAKRVFAAMGAKGRKKEESDQDADAAFLVAVTDHFENFPYPGGPDAIYREPRLKYLADQVRAHLNDLGNFFTSGAKD